ncbi:MAG: hypothetical protein KJ732_07610, partial [Candidatus Margulisbacteria bacterium]|nr:hypothetical protein [Candidatus Margulisiibacteriota bacterium]
MRKFLVILIVAVLTFPAWGQYMAQDPTRYIPNARVLGLGKAYIGLADDAGAIYSNPAGLASIGGWQLSSMSGKFLDEFNYLSFSGLYATQVGVFGVGFAGTSISGAYATTIEAGSDPADPIITIDPSQPLMGNYNNALVFSYGNELKKIRFLDQLPFADRLTFGTNVKMFQVGLYGDGIVGGNASGYELDLGLKLQPPQPWLSLGITGQNLLPFSMGGKLSYASG